MDYAREALRLHREWKGKIEVVATVPAVDTRRSCRWPTPPGWPSPAWRSRRTPARATSSPAAAQPGGGRHRRHRRAGPGGHRPGGRDARDGGQVRPVQGLRRRGRHSPCASGPRTWTRFVQHRVHLLAGSFGGINLEDISAPRCFEIERQLKEMLRHPRVPRRPARHRRHRPGRPHQRPAGGGQEDGGREGGDQRRRRRRPSPSPSCCCPPGSRHMTLCDR